MQDAMLNKSPNLLSDSDTQILAKDTYSSLVNRSIQKIIEPFLAVEFDINDTDYSSDAESTLTIHQLIDFVDECCNHKLLHLAPYCEVSIFHRTNQIEIKQDSRIQAIYDFLVSNFNNLLDKMQIEYCLKSSTTISIHAQNNRNNNIIISTINFSIIKEGIYLNWLATSPAKYNSSTFAKGDNEPFTNRGLSTLLLEMLWQIGLILQPKFIDSLRIMLQVNPDEDAKEYYKNRGFIVQQQNIIDTKLKNSNGQYIHWIKDDAMLFLVLTKFPTTVNCTRAPKLGIRQCLIISPQKKGVKEMKKSIRNR
jgi:hypothetical protein